MFVYYWYCLRLTVNYTSGIYSVLDYECMYVYVWFKLTVVRPEKKKKKIKLSNFLRVVLVVSVACVCVSAYIMQVRKSLCIVLVRECVILYSSRVGFHSYIYAHSLSLPFYSTLR